MGSASAAYPVCAVSACGETGWVYARKASLGERVYASISIAPHGLTEAMGCTGGLRQVSSFPAYRYFPGVVIREGG
jgi:hypothetical protein